MKDEHFIGLYDNVLSEEACGKIIKYFERIYKHPDDQTKSSTLRTGMGSYETDRGELSRHDYQIYLHYKAPAFDLIAGLVNRCWEEYKEKYWVSDYVGVKFEEIKLQKTPIRGGFHDWHCETNELAVVDRCVAWMLYLNDIPEGEGETEFLWQGIRVQPKRGRMLIWPAFYTHTHRGNAVYSHEKYIATGWGLYTNDEFDCSDYFHWDEKKQIYTERKN